MKFLIDLLQRSVPQILGIYLGAGWAIIEFMDWLINQFSISPHLPIFVLLILVSMIPTVIMIAYFHFRMRSSQLDLLSLSQAKSVGEFHQENIGRLAFSVHQLYILPGIEAAIPHIMVPGLGPYQVGGGAGKEFPPDHQVR